MDWKWLGLIAALAAWLPFSAWGFAQTMKEATWAEQRRGLAGFAVYTAVNGGMLLVFAWALAEVDFHFLTLASVAALYFWLAWRYWGAYRRMSR